MDREIVLFGRRRDRDKARSQTAEMPGQ